MNFRTKTKELVVAEADSSSLSNLFNELHIEQEKQLQSLRTRLDQLEFELENKEKEVNVAEGNNDVLRNLYGGLLEENQSLKSQLQSYDNKFKQLESEIEKKTEFDHVCELQFWKATLSQVEYELRTKTEELDVAEANITSIETETEANIIYLKEDLEDDILEYDQLLEETKILRSQLEREIVTDSQDSQQD
ncbi:synaptonemal complex protein 1-like isoform X3 [Prunus yedoensis var. nudiflora]|uniref:Synaptonemal complex protein 1-like isoform X3 n=1 Tax=Prunus yedoensis var. nudiflora TaxID=2094558 RepID=A0A314Y9L8_PRUYE|nr:synaptonemal complex protein 1-like isoform X3 [Prunus yedoensis var. nudiflora]